jgi:uncharacterized protein (DUF433 family)
MSPQTATAEIFHPYVEIRPGIQGGRPVIRGTRFPVTTIVQSYRRGQSVEEILHEYPQLAPEEVHDALSFYYDHRPEIDRLIAELNDLEQIRREYPPTLEPRDLGGR